LTDQAVAPRALPPFFYLFTSATGGIAAGFVGVTLGTTAWVSAPPPRRAPC